MHTSKQNTSLKFARWGKVTASLLLASISLSFTANASAQDAPVASQAKLGMNLAGLSDWEPAYPLVDLFKSSRIWISQKKDMSWGSGAELELDAQGWVKKLEPDCFAEVPFFPHTPGAMPAGEYVVLYEGTGTITLRGVSVVSEAPGRIVFAADQSTSTSFISIMETDPTDYVRNIRILLPGSEATYQENPWNPQFLARWKGVACLRFMDWMDTNHSEISTWDERPKLDDMSYSGAFKGVPLELMIDLANRLETNAWFCIPHRADADYVQKFAEMVDERLNPELKVYVEYSNEVWNGMFKQTKENTEKAVELNIGDPAMPWEGNALLYTQRTVEIGKVWHDVFEDDSRVIRVLAWQCMPYWFEHILLPHNEAFKHIDAIAIAPYINLAVYPSGSENTPNADAVSQWTEDQLFDHVEQVCLPDSIGYKVTLIKF